MGVAPATVAIKQVPPRRAGAQYPEYRIDETSIVLGDTAPGAFLSRQMGFQQAPYMIRNVVPMRALIQSIAFYKWEMP